MPFDNGTVTFRVCRLPRPLPDDALERFAAKAAGPLERVRDEPLVGWVSGRHLLETRIDDETAFAGGYLHLTLRIAQRKIPTSLLRAECRMAELALLAESGQEMLSRGQRKEIKQDIIERLLPQMPPQLTGMPCVIDNASQRLYLGASSDKQLDTFAAYFQQTVGFEPIPLTPEIIVTDLLQQAVEALPPLNFSPAQPDSMAGGTLGQNFLTWLWHYLEEREGRLPRMQFGEFGMMIDGPLVLVAEGGGALESAIRKGAPTISAEAKAALTVGKKLRQAKLIMARSESEKWETSVDADTFVFRGMKLPEGEALDPGSIFQERITAIHTFENVFLNLFKQYVGNLADAAEVSRIQNKAQAWVREMDGK